MKQGWELFEGAAQVDRARLSNPERTGKVLEVNDFSGYPPMGPRRRNPLHRGRSARLMLDRCAGADDPNDTIGTPKQALDKKLSDYSTPETQTLHRAVGAAHD
jgi:hypothetical protein